jgi:glycosyltransferase involved in cell wall biosynthesis
VTVRSTGQQPRLSVIIPARDEGSALEQTVDSIARGRACDEPVEIVIVDDASSDGSCQRLAAASREYAACGVLLKVLRLAERMGIPCARNHGAAAARGDFLFITDAHVRFPDRWDAIALAHADDDVVLSASIADPGSGFTGYGCALDFPSMGTRWICAPPGASSFVPIAPCGGTVISSRLFWRVGGYDTLMPLYGSAEPELSVRLWLSGAKVKVVPELQIGHAFRPRADLLRFQDTIRGTLVHNALRFALLYLTRPLFLQVLRYHAALFATHTRAALQRLESDDVWWSRRELKRRLQHDFGWFVRKFDVRDPLGRTLTAVAG